MKSICLPVFLFCILFAACSGPATEGGGQGTPPDSTPPKRNPFERGHMTQLMILEFQQDSVEAAVTTRMDQLAGWMHNRCAWQDEGGEIHLGHNSDSLLKAGVPPPVLQFMDGRKLKDLSFERVARIYCIAPHFGEPENLEMRLQMFRNRAGKWRESGNSIPVNAGKGMETQAKNLAKSAMTLIFAEQGN